MTRRCTLCDRPDRAEIDRAITSGSEPYRRIATRCDVSEAAVRRHASNHIPDAIAAAVEQQQAQLVAHGGSLLDQVHDLQARALALLAAAETAGDRKSIIGAIREARACIELLARLEGQLAERTNATTVNVLVAPDWMRLRALILHALRPHPDAAQAVAFALVHEGGP